MNPFLTVQRMPTPRPGMPPVYYAGNPELFDRDYTGILLPESHGQQLSDYTVRIGRQCRNAGRSVAAPAGLPADAAFFQAAASAANPAVAVARRSLSELVHQDHYAEPIAAGHLLLISESPPDRTPDAHSIPLTIRALSQQALVLRDGATPGWHLDDPGLPQADSLPREYRADHCVAFRRNRDVYGGLSNMHTAYPLAVAGIHIRTVEHLYQVCRFPAYPKVQQAVLDEPCPIQAKRIARRHIGLNRSDWRRVNIQLMDWCLRLKAAQHYVRMTQLLTETGDLPIVESSDRDDFWGAVPRVGGTLVGHNILGQLLERLRDTTEPPCRSQPAPVSGVLILGIPVSALPCRRTEDGRS